MLTHKLLIYDDACPLCEWYSQLFLKYKFLPAESRMAYSQMPIHLQSIVDVQRSCNEIPLVDTQSNEVLYGVDAIVEVLNNKLPFIKPIASIGFVNVLLKKLYKLISFNRKGIVAKVPAKGIISCTPSYSFLHKKLFISLCFLLAAVFYYSVYASHVGGWGSTLFTCSGLLVLASIFTINKKILEGIQQWQIQLLICMVVLLPAIYLLRYSQVAVGLYILVALFFFSKQIWKRIMYWKWFANTL